ncbi:helix-turn-helix domain-containing protein [Acidovorax sp. FG27]|uniref:helix-turn-helix domain-containing protein n=1 Tax=Acidovorax sp. FG27 TaxID=3133652 RepID=UPI0030E7A748
MPTAMPAVSARVSNLPEDSHSHGWLDAQAKRTWQSPKEVDLRIAILLWPGFPLLSLAGLCDALRHAADVGDRSRQIHCGWRVLGHEGERVRASCGVEVPVQEVFSSRYEFDYLAVIGGLLSEIDRVPPGYTRYLKDVAYAGVPLIGVCTGSFVLTRLGLMDQRVACVHPYHVEDWKRFFPQQAFVTHTDFFLDRDRITCAGGISVIELVAELTRRHCGPGSSAKVIHQMTVSRRQAQGQMGKRQALGYISTERDMLRQAVLLMEKNLATPLSIAVIARLVGAGVRQLERAFMTEVGMSPSQHYRGIRLKYARWLLTTSDMPVNEIAFECGFADASHLIRHFRTQFGMAPGQLRKALESIQADSPQPTVRR